ncbi:hypothetical protein FJTKL_11254 [Diaporthe vaccinii]|uniref:Phosphatidyl-N-methylethanolamine N-methyltransferase n=1 Tax=Diaporthe vaccinii TaxID=105482 RepID=A0ABR4EH49_9PEZI
MQMPESLIRFMSCLFLSIEPHPFASTPPSPNCCHALPTLPVRPLLKMAPIVQQHQLVDLSQKSLFVSAAAIAFNPTFWNIVARREYRTRFMTKTFGGNAQRACYALAATIFGLGLCRDFLYERALRHQPPHPLLDTDAAKYLGYALIAGGNILVVTSTWALGITGTFLGDYFGILMDDMVTGFPFSVCDAPMYYGSTMSFLGTALLYGRPAGILLTAWVLTVYLVALQEGLQEQGRGQEAEIVAVEEVLHQALPRESLSVALAVTSELWRGLARAE